MTWESLTRRARPGLVLAIALSLAAVAYIAWKIGESPSQALQVTINGLNVGAVYALLALGFTLVYSTVWFFDLYYGAAAAMGAYGVFYLRSRQAADQAYDPGNSLLNIVFGVVIAGVAAWALHTAFYERFRPRYGRTLLRTVGAALAAAAGLYGALILWLPDHLHLTTAPLVTAFSGVIVGLTAYWLLRRFRGEAANRRTAAARMSAVIGLAAGGAAGLFVALRPEASLYLSWVVSCLLAGCVGLALYRGLYVLILLRARSTLIMLVATLGVLLTVSALIVIIFTSTTHALPESLGSQPIAVGGATFKAFAVFTVGCAFTGFFLLWLLLYRTSLGKVIRAIGDDEQVARVVGINTTAVIAIVFFIGAVYAAFAGILTGQDLAIQPRMGLELLLKGWIASVVGGIGGLYGAIVGGFLLGLVEQFGIWDISGEWQDAVSLLLLVIFLAFWPKGIIPRT